MNRRILIEADGLPDTVPLQRNLFRNEVLLLPGGALIGRYEHSGLQIVASMYIDDELKVETSHIKSDEGKIGRTDHITHAHPCIWLDTSQFPSLTSYHEDGMLQFYEVGGESKSSKVPDSSFSTVTSEAVCAIMGKDGNNMMVVNSNSLKVYNRQGRKLNVIIDMNTKKMLPDEIQGKFCAYNGTLGLIASGRIAQIWAFSPEIPAFEAKMAEFRAPNENSFLFTCWHHDVLTLISATHIISIQTDYILGLVGQRLKHKNVAPNRNNYNTLIGASSLDASGLKSKREVELPRKIVYAFADEEYIITVEDNGLITVRDYLTLEVQRILNVPIAPGTQLPTIKKMAIRREEFNTSLFVLRDDKTLSVYDMFAKASKPIRVFTARENLRDFLIDGPSNVYAVSESVHPIVVVYLWRVNLKPRSTKNHTQHFSTRALFKRFYSPDCGEMKERFVSVGQNDDKSEGMEPPFEVEDCTDKVVMGVDLYNYSQFHNQTRFPTTIFYLFHEIYHRATYQRNLFQQNWGNLVLDVFPMINENRVESMKNADAGLLAEALKYWLQSFQEPLFTFSLYTKLLAAADAPADKRVEKTEEVIKELPPTNLLIFQLLIITLDRIVQCKDITNCTASQLGITFGPFLIGGFGSKNNANINMPKLAVLGRVFMENIAKTLASQHTSEGLTNVKIDQKGPNPIEVKRSILSEPLPSNDSQRGQINQIEDARSKFRVSLNDYATVMHKPETPSQLKSISPEKKEQLINLVGDLIELFRSKLEFTVSNMNQMNNVFLAEKLGEAVGQFKLLVVDNLEDPEWQPEPDLHKRIRKHIDNEARTRVPNLNETNALTELRKILSKETSEIYPKLNELSQSVQNAGDNQLLEIAVMTQKMKRILL
eukprot:TRINITY_DN2951_c0_g1_i1.p1 TRINITY_DN2951_c0_g1~~TRINITY_DN2951_c0_g1_i1.p1  ORF type:complete len:881 (+),score=291.04 TRINITY_DN2951_c0_g1_i1:220-2862(+)